jgi:hypothetical protein
MIVVNYRGVNSNIPEPTDPWTQSLTAFLVLLGQTAVSAGLIADADFGTLFGVAAIYFRSKTALPALSGILRLAKTDFVAWRNNANSADLALGIDSADKLTFAGQNITGNPFLGANTTAAQSISSSATTIVVFGTVELDSDSGYNSGTGRYIIPAGKGGHYMVTASIMWSTAPGTGGTLAIFKAGSVVKEIAPEASATNTTYSIDALLVLAAGDVIDIRATQTSGAAIALNATAARNFVALKRIPT